MVRYVKGRNIPINSLGEDVNVDSDCEGDSTVPDDGMLEENESRAVLITGSFSAYVQFLAPPSHREE